jgi:transketolase
MALAEKLLAQEFNRPGHDIVDHYTYVFLGDGCLMEGISHEVCSLAGTLKLNKLIALWDDNGISIDGKVVSWFNEDTPKRFEAYGWNVIRDVDGHDAEAVSSAIAQAKKSDKPTLICCKTAIGQGSPNMAGSDKVHGSPLGAAEIAATRVALNWPYAPFEINPESEKGQVKALQALRAKRDNALVEKTLAELHTVAKSGENIMEACIAAVKAYATVGEIVNELRKVYGKWQPTRTF